MKGVAVIARIATLRRRSYDLTSPLIIFSFGTETAKSPRAAENDENKTSVAYGSTKIEIEEGLIKTEHLEQVPRRKN